MELGITEDTPASWPGWLKGVSRSLMDRVCIMTRHVAGIVKGFFIVPFINVSGGR